jgi:hypothetical protein
MNLQYILPRDWEYFLEKYPDAYAYLGRCSLIREWESLAHDESTGIALNEWQTKRLTELNNLFSNR